MRYAGIGSRETPIEILVKIEQIAEYLARTGHTLFSGGANGADFSFERGCDKGNGKKKIFLPWRYFNDNDSPLYYVSEEAKEIASKYHPYWLKLNPPTKKLMGRNSYQVLDEDLQSPVDMVICWTPNGSGKGGTGQAIRIANDLGIPVYDLGRQGALEELCEIIFNK